MHGTNSEVCLPHLFGQPVDFTFCVAEYDSLGDRECVVQIAEGVEFPFLTFHGYEELFDSFQCQFVTEK